MAKTKIRLTVTDILLKHPDITSDEIFAAAKTLNITMKGGFTQEEVDRIIAIIPAKSTAKPQEQEKSEDTAQTATDKATIAATALGNMLQPKPAFKKFSDFLKEHFIYEPYLDEVAKLGFKAQQTKEMIEVDINGVFLYVCDYNKKNIDWHYYSVRWFAIDYKEFDMYALFEDIDIVQPTQEDINLAKEAVEKINSNAIALGADCQEIVLPEEIAAEIRRIAKEAYMQGLKDGEVAAEERVKSTHNALFVQGLKGISGAQLCVVGG